MVLWAMGYGYVGKKGNGLSRRRRGHDGGGNGGLGGVSMSTMELHFEVYTVHARREWVLMFCPDAERWRAGGFDGKLGHNREGWGLGQGQRIRD